MADVNYTQSNFTRGEIDPLLLARFDYEGYAKFVKRARNCLTIPQGPIRRRFGTTSVASISAAADDEIEIVTFLYNDIATYLFAFSTDTITVFLENIIITTITSTGYLAPDIKSIRFSQVENRLVVTSPDFQPKQIAGPTGSAIVINGFDATTDYLQLASAPGAAVGTIGPVVFTGSSLPATSPQIYAGRNYFFRMITTTRFKLYSNSADAAADENAYQITSAGSGSPTATVQYVFALSNISFKNLPSYDFGNVNYSAVTFTPNPTSLVNVGGTIVIDASGGTPFTSAYVGGIFSSGGGAMRITAVNSSSKITGYLISQFPDNGASTPLYIGMNGALSFLGEPAWSTARGWPRCSTFFQNRLWLAGTPSIPNGVWGSVVNDALDFDDSESFADNAIAYYPASGNMTFVQSMTSTRSLLVHTITGTYSTPLTTDFPITPDTVSFVEQNKDGVSPYQPIVIDNQVIFVDSSQNNVKNLVWEFSAGSYVLRNISITNNSIIRRPTDIANFTNPLFIDGSYAFLTNDDGTLAAFQTLYTEDVAGWTLSDTKQRADIDGDEVLENQFVHVASSLERVWFVVKRQKFTAQTPSPIASVAANVFTITSSPITVGGGINGTDVYLAKFSGVVLPVTTPQIVNTKYYYVRRQSSNETIKVYSTYDNAINDFNAFTLTSIGTTAVCTISTLSGAYFIEELDFNSQLDATLRRFSSNGTISGLTLEEGMWLQVVADGYVFPPQQVFNGTIVFDTTNHWAEVLIGYPFTTEVTFLPVNNLLTTGSNFYKPKLFRQFYLYYHNTVGASINGVEFPNIPIEEYSLEAPPEPSSGIVNFPPMVGWEPLTQDITVTQSNPLPLTILGYSVSVEIK